MNARGLADQLPELENVRLTPERKTRLAGWIREASEHVRRRDALVLDLRDAYHKGNDKKLDDVMRQLDAMKYDADGTRRAPLGIGIGGPCGGEHGTAYQLIDIDIDGDVSEWTPYDDHGMYDDPHVIAIWDSRRGTGMHGLFLCEADGASFESARRYILRTWPKADPSAIALRHTILPLFGFDKGSAIPYRATDIERAQYVARIEQERADRERRDLLHGDVEERQKTAFFASYMDGLRKDCSTHLSHADMVRTSARCGCVLRDTEHDDDATVMECARIIHGGTMDAKGRPRETLGAVVRAIQWGIEKGTFHVEIGGKRAAKNGQGRA